VKTPLRGCEDVRFARYEDAHKWDVKTRASALLWRRSAQGFAVQTRISLKQVRLNGFQIAKSISNLPPPYEKSNVNN